MAAKDEEDEKKAAATGGLINDLMMGIEVIAKAGFNDTILSVACLTEEKIRKEIDESTSA